MRYCSLVSVVSVLAAIPPGSSTKHRSPRWNDMHTKHSWNAVPENWESLGYPPNGTLIDLYIGLKPYHENALIEALYEVSGPNNPRYGQHLSEEQVAELVAPHQGTLELIHSWLRHHGVPSSSALVTHAGTVVTLNGVSVIQANALLGALYQVYRHVETNETIIRTVGYALPAALHELVQTVAPTTFFVSRPAQWQSPRKRSSEAARLPKPSSKEPMTTLSSRDDDSSTTPSFLRSLYRTVTYTPDAEDRNVLGLVGFKDDYPNPADLAAFMRKYRSDETGNPPFNVIQVNGGGYDPSHPHDESNLDTQYAMAIAYPTPLVFYSTGTGSGTTEYYLSWLASVLGLRKIPQTISGSYVIDERFVPREYAVFLCNLFALLGLRGVSVLFSSGDFGVGRGDCVTGDGSVQFVPVFPASCPYVTAVGGTTSHTPEAAAILSGGGFSNHFLRPGFQQKAVPAFFQRLGNQHQGKYNDSGRGIPDIAAQAMDFPIFSNSVEKFVSGTSGSAPIVAGIISLLNDYLISKGKGPLGFLNPLLYGPVTTFRGLSDITIGSNPGCKTQGFSAVEGWDPVTGLGTPDFERLQLILDLILLLTEQPN